MTQYCLVVLDIAECSGKLLMAALSSDDHISRNDNGNTSQSVNYITTQSQPIHNQQPRHFSHTSASQHTLATRHAVLAY